MTPQELQQYQKITSNHREEVSRMLQKELGLTDSDRNYVRAVLIHNDIFEGVDELPIFKKIRKQR